MGQHLSKKKSEKNIKDSLVLYNQLLESKIEIIDHQKIPISVCQKPVINIYFKCFDCAKGQDHKIICLQCFLKSNHIGHKVLYFNTNVVGSCFCGIEDNCYFGCSDHQPENKRTRKEYIDALPLKDQINIQFLLSYNIQSVFQDFDENQAVQANIKLNYILKQILNLESDCPPVAFFVGEKFKDQLEQFQTTHICNNLTFVAHPPLGNNDNEQIESVQKQIMQLYKCNCSILKNLFRYSAQYNKENERLLCHLIQDLFFVSEFKTITVKVYCEMIDFIVTPQSSYFLFDLIDFFSTSEYLIELIMKSKQLRLIIQKKFEEGYNILMSPAYVNSVQPLIKLLKFFQVISSLKYEEIWKENFDFFQILFKCIIKSQPHDFYDDNQIKCQLQIDRLAIKIFIQIVNSIYNLPILNRHLIQFLLKETLLYCVQRVKNKVLQYIVPKQMTVNQIWPLFTTPYRMLGVILAKVLLQSGVNKMMDYLQIVQKQIFKTEMEFQELMGKIFEDTIRSFLFIKNNEEKPNQNQQMIIMMLNIGNSYQIINQLYKFHDSLLGDIDFVTMQLMFTIINEKDIMNHLIQGLYIQSELSNICMNMQECNILIETLVRVSVDEISMINLAQLIEENENESVKISIEKAIVNISYFNTQYDYSNVKQRLKSTIIQSGSLKNGLTKTVKINNKNKTYRLNQMLQKLHEPYFWINDPLIHQDFYEKIKEHCQKDEDYDLVFGNNSDFIYKLKNPHKNLLIAIISNLQQCDDFFFLMELIFTNVLQIFNNQNKYLILQNSLKLFITQIFTNQLRSIEKNQFKIFLEQDFHLLSKLEILVNDKDLKNTMKKLIKIIQDYQINRESLKILQKIDQDKEQSNKKNSNSKIKQQQLMNQFQQRQKQFSLLHAQLQPIKEKLNDAGINEDEKEEDQQDQEGDSLQCIICQSYSSKDNNLLFLCYIDRDNLSQYYDNENNKDRDFSSFSFNCCNHPVHKVCYQQYQQMQKEKIKNNSQNQLFNKLKSNESFCYLCSFLTNFTLTQVEPYSMQDQLIYTIDQQSQDKEMQFIFIEIHNKPAESQQQEKDLNQEKEEQGQINNEQLNNDQCNETNIINQQQDDQNSNKKRNLEDDFNFVQQIQQLQLQKNFSYIQFIKQILSSILEKCFSNGLSIYLTQLYQVSKNFCLNCQSLKTEFSKELLIHNNMVNLDKLNQFLIFGNLLKNMIINQCYSFDNIWIDSVTSLFVQHINNLPLLLRKINNLCILYIHYLLFFYGYLNSLQNDIKITNFAELKNLLQNNKDYYLKVCGFILPYIRLVVGTYLTLFKFKQNQIIKLSQNFADDYQEYNLICEILGQQFFLISDKLTQNNSFWSQFFQDIQMHSKKKEIFNFLNKNPCFKFQLIELKQSYFGMHNQYFFKRCSLCQSYPIKQNQGLLICLICGVVLCNQICKENRLIGNINYHAVQCHYGKTVFMDLQSTHIVYIDCPKTIIYGLLYLDQFGDTVDRYFECNWKMYKLNKNLYYNIKEVIFQRKIPQQICSFLMQEDRNILINMKGDF